MHGFPPPTRIRPFGERANPDSHAAALVAYSDSSTGDVTNQVNWNSSTSAVFISSTGVATGTAVGVSNITASRSGLTSNAFTLTVTPAPLVSIAISAPA